MNTYVAALRQLADWAERLEADGTFGELDGLILQAGFGEYLQQLRYGIPLSQGEIVRPADMGITDEALRDLAVPDVETLTRSGQSQTTEARSVGEEGGRSGRF